ncbi:hypothetical protein SAMN05421823_10930 [Catalinimonas alkaloidigena]|uniref:Uncharacterized protein n=1 Tax=Catalinimonas alkaloidigena TaxID=1075417 RepID=A0A1G9NZS7_9BACT|nr:hypothetical protein [Catalinimonas alkaloidigena]SDL91884.1 hypothetical protein SAMN05421823_10930 [Catalinimonas alkaloidigena]
MTTIPKPLSVLHDDHQTWTRQLDFYRDELQVLNNRLGEVSIHTTQQDVKAWVDHFETQLIIQNELIDELRHAIGVHEHTLERQAQEYPVASDYRRLEDHAEMRGQMQVFVRLYGEMKNDLNRFLSRTL